MQASEDLLDFVRDRRFRTVLADPPWQFANRTGKIAPEHKRLSRYPTLTLDGILALPVAQITTPTAHLYLWCPNALLPEGLCGRILKADDARTELRCISLTSIFRAMERSALFIARVRKGSVVEYGPLWDVDNQATLKRTTTLITGYFEFIRLETVDLWAKGSGEGGGLSMNDGVTVCINVLRSIFLHLQNVKHFPLATLSDGELVEIVEPWARKVGGYFAALTPERMIQFRALRGIQGQTTGTRRIEEHIRQSEPTFEPPGLKDFLEREKAQTTTHAFEEIRSIEQILQATVLTELKNEFGVAESDWWFAGVPKGVRKKVDDRINEEGGKKGGREQNFDLIDYREIVHANWELFEPSLARGKGAKDNKTKWMVEVNDLRKPVVHASKGQSLPITEEQLALLEEIHQWLEERVSDTTFTNSEA